MLLLTTQGVALGYSILPFQGVRKTRGAISAPLYRVNCRICANFMVIIASVKLVSSGAI